MNIIIKGRFKNGKFRIIEENIENGLTNQFYYDIIERVKKEILTKDIYLKYEDILIIFRENDKIKQYKFLVNNKYNYENNIEAFSKSIYNNFIKYSKGELFYEESREKSLQARSADSIRTRSGCNAGICGQGSRESVKNERGGQEVGGVRPRHCFSTPLCHEAKQKDNSIRLLLHERPIVANANDFRNAIVSFKKLSSNSQAVDVHDLAEYNDMKCLLYGDSTAGVAVEKSGNIVSVFKSHASTIKGFATIAIKDAVSNGGTKLDCYSTRNKLPNAYMQAGMKPICKIKFNREFAPEGWDFEHDGEPDIVFMAIGDNTHERYEDYTDEEVPYIEDSETESAYDLAEKYRDNWIKTQIKAKRNLDGVNKFMGKLSNLINNTNKKKDR